MSWCFWLLCGILAASALFSILEIGKPRKPLTANTASLTVVLSALLIAGIIYYGGN